MKASVYSDEKDSPRRLLKNDFIENNLEKIINDNGGENEKCGLYHMVWRV